MLSRAIGEVSKMEPDSRGPKPSEDRSGFLVESTDSRAVDALQAKLFAKALVGLGLPQYSALIPDRRRSPSTWLRV